MEILNRHVARYVFLFFLCSNSNVHSRLSSYVFLDIRFVHDVKNIVRRRHDNTCPMTIAESGHGVRWSESIITMRSDETG